MLSTTLPAHLSINSDSGCRAIWVARDCAIDCESPLFSLHFQPHTRRITRFISTIQKAANQIQLVFFQLSNGRLRHVTRWRICVRNSARVYFPNISQTCQKVISDIRSTRISWKFAFLERIMEPLCSNNVYEPSIKLLKNYFMYFCFGYFFFKENNSK